MKKLSLYIFLILMYCDIAYATFLESLVVGLIISILTAVAFTFTNSLIPVYIIYGIGIIWTVLFWGSVLSNSKKIPLSISARGIFEIKYITKKYFLALLKLYRYVHSHAAICKINSFSKLTHFILQ